METVGIRVLADELNVNLRMVWDFIRAGHLTLHEGGVTKDSADELRWHLAVHKHLLRSPTGQSAA